MDYCYWRGERCRYVAEDREWECDFHRAFNAGDVGAMQASLLETPSGRMPAGLIVESVDRRDDGSYAFVVVALPGGDHDHPIIEACERALNAGEEERAPTAR